MHIFAISDLHLSFANAKPMDIFGDQWIDHAARIANAWDNMVSDEDYVIVAGDISWALKAEDAAMDLDFVAKRPGRKILIRGNHDYWWAREATNRLNRQSHESIFFLQGHCMSVDGVAIAATRGWRIEEDPDPVHAQKIMDRELRYFETALREIPTDATHRIAVLHFPPYGIDFALNDFAALAAKYQVDQLIYGHIHGGAVLEGNIDGVIYRLTSSDHLGFAPLAVYP